jgi:sterol desaturase/sphingolipid hydroxylase (fatty acid hydroxylase superfamily)
LESRTLSVSRLVVSEFSLRVGFSVLIGLVITAGLILAIFEYVGRSRLKDGYPFDSVKLSLSALGPNLVTFVVLAPYWATVYLQVGEFVPRSIPISGLSLFAAFMACDLSYYVEHRCGHQIRLLWRLHHGTHHHSDLYNVPLAYRVSFLTQVTAPLFYIPWLFLGFHPLLIVGFQVFVLHYQAWIHTETIGRLGILDTLINTPAVHRMHHSKRPEHQAVNLGGVTLLWDHLLRTYCAPQDDVNYGVEGAPASSTYSGIYLDPWRRG